MSNAKSETIVDIVREMRTLGRLDEKSTDKIPRSLQALGLRTYADRIEAAARREREAGAAAAQICGEVGEMVGREAARRSDERTAEKYSAVGNAAAMREALCAITLIDTRMLKRLLCELVEADIFDGGQIRNTIHAVEKARQAIAAPPRNCDAFSKDNVLETLKDRSFSKEDTIEWLYGKE